MTDPTRRQIMQMADEVGIADYAAAARLVRLALAVFRPAPVPVPVSERPWEREGWCDEEGRCWCLSTLDDSPPRWWLVRPEPLSHGFTLPAHALPLPQGEVE